MDMLSDWIDRRYAPSFLLAFVKDYAMIEISFSREVSNGILTVGCFEQRHDFYYNAF